jgi:hypothetical protein
MPEKQSVAMEPAVCDGQIAHTNNSKQTNKANAQTKNPVENTVDLTQRKQEQRV